MRAVAEQRMNKHIKKLQVELVRLYGKMFRSIAEDPSSNASPRQPFPQKEAALT